MDGSRSSADCNGLHQLTKVVSPSLSPSKEPSNLQTVKNLTNSCRKSSRKRLERRGSLLLLLGLMARIESRLHRSILDREG